MAKQEKESARLYLIRDNKTKKPYINNSDTAIAYSTEEGAKAFVNRNKEEDISIVPIYKNSYTDVKSLAYAAGASHFILRARGDSTDEVVQDLCREELNRQYYNRRLNRIIARALRSNRYEEIKPLFDCRFLVAVIIDEESVSYVTYASVRNSSGNKAIVAFSDMQEFRRWIKANPRAQDRFQLVEVDFKGMWRLAGIHGFLLNPGGTRLFISPDMIMNVLKMNNAAPRKGGKF